MGWFDRLKAGLSKTREILTADVRDLSAIIKSQEVNWDDLEFALINADVGAKLSAKIVAEAKESRELGKSFIEGLEAIFTKSAKSRSTKRPTRGS